MLDDPTFLMLAGGLLASGSLFLFDAAARDRRHGWRCWLWPLATVFLAAVFVAKVAGRGEMLMLSAGAGIVVAASTWARDAWSVRGILSIVAAVGLVFAGEKGLMPRDLALGTILMVAGLAAATSRASVFPRAIAALALICWGVLTTPSLAPTLGHLGPAIGPILGPVAVATFLLAVLSSCGALPERDWLTHPNRKGGPDSEEDRTARSWVWATDKDLRFTSCPTVLGKALHGRSGGRRRSDPQPTLRDAIGLCPTEGNRRTCLQAVEAGRPFGPIRIEWAGGRSSGGGSWVGSDRIAMNLSGTPVSGRKGVFGYKGDLSLAVDQEDGSPVANEPQATPSAADEVLGLVEAGVLVLDRDARITVLNPALAVFLRLENDKAEQLVGRPLFTLLRVLASDPAVSDSVPETLARGLLDRIDPAASSDSAPSFTWSLPDGRAARVSVRTRTSGGLVASFSEETSPEAEPVTGATRP